MSGSLVVTATCRGVFLYWFVSEQGQEMRMMIQGRMMKKMRMMIQGSQGMRMKKMRPGKRMIRRKRPRSCRRRGCRRRRDRPSADERGKSRARALSRALFQRRATKIRNADHAHARSTVRTRSRRSPLRAAPARGPCSSRGSRRTARAPSHPLSARHACRRPAAGLSLPRSQATPRSRPAPPSLGPQAVGTAVSCLVQNAGRVRGLPAVDQADP